MRINPPMKRSPTGHPYKLQEYNKLSDAVGIASSPISLHGLSFFEFDEVTGDYGELQNHRVESVAAR